MPATSVFKIGDRGAGVKSLQQYLGVKDDSIFGPITQAAQSAYNLGKNTSPTKNKPKKYSTVARPLSADTVMALGNKRLAADQGLQFAKQNQKDGTGRFRASFEAAKSMMNREMKTASRKLSNQLAGRGLARSPMLAGRGQIEIGRKFDDTIGQMQLTMTNDIEALKQATEQARLERQNILADIELQESLLRSDPEAYVTQGG